MTEFIPAIDIKNRKCVRLYQGKSSRETVYSDDPVGMALRWEDEGAERLHVIDLDGAFAEGADNRDIILRIASRTSLEVQTGGGIRNRRDAFQLLEGGVGKIIIGTRAVTDPDLVADLLKEWPGRVMVGIDSYGGKVATGGWKEVSDMEVSRLAFKMCSMGVPEMIVTDTVKDGTMKGPNLRLLKQISEKVSCGLIASGGISSMKDIESIMTSGISGLTGIISGRAIYDGSIAVREAVKYVRKKGDEDGS